MWGIKEAPFFLATVKGLWKSFADVSKQLLRNSLDPLSSARQLLGSPVSASSHGSSEFGSSSNAQQGGEKNELFGEEGTQNSTGGQPLLGNLPLTSCMVQLRKRTNTASNLLVIHADWAV